MWASGEVFQTLKRLKEYGECLDVKNESGWIVC